MPTEERDRGRKGDPTSRPRDTATHDVAGSLDALLRRAVREELEEVMTSIATSPRPALLDTAELARELSTSEGTIRRQRKLGLPTVMLGDSPRFDLDEVLAWLRSRP